VSRLPEITERLQQIARELDSDETDDERAADLAREAAALAAEAAEEAGSRARGADDASGGE
jgi:hypothetical protein